MSVAWSERHSVSTSYSVNRATSLVEKLEDTAKSDFGNPAVQLTDKAANFATEAMIHLKFVDYPQHRLLNSIDALLAVLEPVINSNEVNIWARKM